MSVRRRITQLYARRLRTPGNFYYGYQLASANAYTEGVRSWGQIGTRIKGSERFAAVDIDRESDSSAFGIDGGGKGIYGSSAQGARPSGALTRIAASDAMRQTEEALRQLDVHLGDLAVLVADLRLGMEEIRQLLKEAGLDEDA